MRIMSSHLLSAAMPSTHAPLPPNSAAKFSRINTGEHTNISEKRVVLRARDAAANDHARYNLGVTQARSERHRRRCPPSHVRVKLARDQVQHNVDVAHAEPKRRAHVRRLAADAPQPL